MNKINNNDAALYAYDAMSQQEKVKVGLMLDAAVQDQCNSARALSTAILISIALIVGACLIIMATAN